MSPQHRWLQARLARVCNVLGYAAITEHDATDSDVYVPAVRFSLEVQRWSTDFPVRIENRRRKGAQTLWFVTEDAKGTADSTALFEYPAVRLSVVERDSRPRKALRPWDNPADSRHAILEVFATAARFDNATQKLVTHRMDGPRVPR